MPTDVPDCVAPVSGARSGSPESEDWSIKLLASPPLKRRQPWWAALLLPLRISLPLVLLVSGLSGSGIMLYRELSQSDRQAREEMATQGRLQGERNAALLAYLYRSNALTGTPLEGIDILMGNLGTDPNLDLALIVQNDRVRSANRYELRDRVISKILLPPELAAMGRSLEGLTTSVTSQMSATNAPTVTVIVPFSRGAEAGRIRTQDNATLILRYDLSNTLATSRIESIQHVALYSLPLAVTCLGAWLALNWVVTRRIGRLRNFSRRLRTGDFSARVQLCGYDEIATLGEAFDRTAATLQRDREALQRSELVLRQRTAQLEETLAELQTAQTKLVQTEKMSSLGQMVAGLAHELNNPVSFIYTNTSHLETYTHDILRLLGAYRDRVIDRDAELRAMEHEVDLDFLMDDLPALTQSMAVGAQRIRNLVLSLRNFSRLDEADYKIVDIHEGIDNTLTILGSKLRASPTGVERLVERQYGDLPLVGCYPGALNQAIMNVLANAIDALDTRAEACQSDRDLEPPRLVIRTTVEDDRAIVAMTDNGSGMTPEVQLRLFDPFFTTKPVGKGTGLGMAITYQIVVDQHGGKLTCHSTPDIGSTFTIAIPLEQAQ